MVERLRRRDESAVAALFDQYYKRLHLFAEKFIYDSDQAHDIVQDVFLKLWENAEKLTLKVPVGSYLFAAVRNGCLNYLRDLEVEDRNNRKYAEACVESDNVDMVDDEELWAKVCEAVDNLPERYREVCVMRFMDGCKYSEIAVKLGLNEDTVKTRLRRGLERLRDVLSDYEFVVLLGVLVRLFG